MNTSQRPSPPTFHQIDTQVESICDFLDPSEEGILFEYLIQRDRESSTEMTVVHKVVMEYLAWNQAREQGGAAFEAHGVKDRYSRATLPSEKDVRSEASKGRSLARRLRNLLQKYYQSHYGMGPIEDRHRDPHPSEVTARRAEWILYIEIPLGDGYKPVIEWRTTAIKRAIEVVQDRIDFERIGSNVEAMQYLVKRIPLATRIEDTAIRWDANKMPYTDLSGFRNALKESKATYALITGPVKFKSYMEVLREVYSEKPNGNELLECFRLERPGPIMNFTILYYPDQPAEVLYGYGIQQGRNSLKRTTVFRTNNPDLVKEYKRLFDALRNHHASYPMYVHDPDFIDSDEHESDILATFNNFGEVPIGSLIKKEPCERIRLCVTCSSEIDRLLAHFKAISSSTVMQILLAHRDSPFLKQREDSLSRPLQSLVDSNLKSLKGLLPRNNFEVKLTGKPMPVMLKQIGPTMIFSPFWNGIPVATGPQFMVRTNSGTGASLETQFNALWKDKDAVTVDLSASEIVIPPLPNS